MTNQNRVNIKIKYYTDLHGEELTDKWQKDHVFTVPHLFGIDLYSTSELPPLTAVLHEDLNMREMYYLHLKENITIN